MDGRTAYGQVLRLLSAPSGFTANRESLIRWILAGSYYVETLTREMEQGCWEYFEKIDAMGGMVRAIEHCFPQREIQDAAYQYQRAVERKEKLIVGVNEFRVEEETGIETLAIDSEVAAKQKTRLQEVRASRALQRCSRHSKICGGRLQARTI
jgi:methylmalonyl-CoA mutase N-terminal domain/subunit